MRQLAPRIDVFIRQRVAGRQPRCACPGSTRASRPEMPKRAAPPDAGSGGKADAGVGGLKSRSGRVVKPKLFDDGTVAVPVAVLKEDAGGCEGHHGGRGGGPAAACDPGHDGASPEAPEEGRGSQEAAHHGHGGGHHHAHTSEDEALSGEGPMGSMSREGSRNSGRTARSGSVGRDESGRLAGGGRTRGRGGRGRGEAGGGIFKQAAVEVLRHEKRLMSTGEIARVALKRGLIKCTGKTPEATMASALYTDIKRKARFEGHSVFIRPHEGLFGLREWIEQGVVFQDDYAEEMAKRARATFGAYLGLPGLPPLLAHGLPGGPGGERGGAGAGAGGHPGLPGGAYPHPALMGYTGLPPHMGLVPPGLEGFHPHPGAPYLAAAAAAAMGRKASPSESPDGLMELLSAAEELHRSNSKDLDGPAGKGTREDRAPSTAETRERTAPKSAAAPAGRAAAAAADGAAGQRTPAAAEGARAPGSAEGAAPMDVEPGADGERQQQRQQHADEEGGGGGGAAARPASEVQDVAELLAAVAAERPKEGTPEGPHGFPGFPGPHAYPYPLPPYAYPPPYYHPYYGPPAAYAMPPAPAAGGRRGAAAAAQREAGGGLSDDGGASHEGEEGGLLAQLVVRGSNRPFAGGGGSAPGGGRPPAPATGQEQVNTNILNLPLPDLDAAAGAGAGETGAPPAARVPAERLKEAEAQVMAMEKEMGMEHPEVGKAYLSLSRLYVADCADSTAKQLAEAALGRAYDIMASCQMSLQRRPACTSSFSFLLDRIRSAPGPPRPLGPAVANGDAHLALPSGVAAH
eukprot:scaffold12.g8047.t1